MAFDQPNNPLSGGQDQVTTNSSSTNNAPEPRKEPLSPWEEELPPEVPKEQKIGTLSNVGRALEPQVIKEESPFVVPQNIENQTPLNVVSGTDFTSNNENENQNVSSTNNLDSRSSASPSTKTEVPAGTVRSGSEDISFSKDLSSSNNSPTPDNSLEINQTDNHQGEEDDFDDLDIFGDTLNGPRAISSDIKPSSSSPSPTISLPSDNPSTTTSSPITSESSAPQQPPQTLAQQQQTYRVNIPPSASQSMNNQPAVRPTVQQNPAITKESEIVGASPTEQSRKNPLLSFLRRRKQNQMPELVAEEPNLTVSTDQSLARAPMLKRIPKPLLVTGGIVLFLSGLISMTEMGVLSIGLEKVYNSVGLEVLWGGLPKNSEHSLGKALIAMQGKSGFKVKGKINLNVNKAVESPVTTPLVSYDKAGRMATILVRPEKAILAVTEEDYIDSSDTSSDGTLTDEDKQAISGWEDSGTASDSASTDSSSSSSDESSSSDDSSTTTDDSSSFSDVQDQESTTLDDQESLNSYEEAQTDTKDVSAEIEGFVSTKGSEINLSVDKAGTSEINLKNNGEKLWVKSDKILFNESAEEGKWLEYSISALQDRNLLESALGGDLENVTVEGSKIGNQKIGNTRCYNYKIDELDIGNMLSDIGISSDMVQAISGNAWIGIKDKLIRRLDLKITPSSSGPVNSVELSLEFSDYGKENSFTNPSSSDVITDLSPFTPSSEEEEVEETDQADETTTTEENQPTQVDKTAENDQKRKADLATLKNALESYKAEYGKYPIAPTTLKLNIESNLISQKLAPDYITSLPKDPLDSEGWFYGYKSIDGKSYYVSARLENVNDPEIKVVDNINLYFLYNE